MCYHSCGGFRPTDVGSLPPLDEIAARVHQEQIVAEETTQNFGEITKECVAPTPAATDMDVWVESSNSLHDVPLAERLRLRREAYAESAERAAAELLSEDVAAGAPSSSPSSPALKKAKGRHKRSELWTVYEKANACPGRFSNTGHRVMTYVDRWFASPYSRREKCL